MQGPYTKYQGHGLPEEDNPGPEIVLPPESITTTEKIAREAIEEMKDRLIQWGIDVA